MKVISGINADGKFITANLSFTLDFFFFFGLQIEHYNDFSVQVLPWIDNGASNPLSLG